MARERIITPVTYEWMHPEVQHLRRNSAQYLSELATSVDVLRGRGRDLDRATFLDGGIMSVCYLIPSAHQPIVAKFSIVGEPQEGRVLTTWKQRGIKVPAVYDHGIVSSTQQTDIPVGYTLMEAVSNAVEEVASTADTMIVRDPSIAYAIGRSVGQELGKMHQIVISSDIRGSKNVIDEFNTTASTWNGYVRQEIANYIPILRELGYTHQSIARLLDTISTLSFGESSTYIHNDPSPRNVLVRSEYPIDICLIDPNPIIGNRYWDLAHIVNKTEAARIKSELDSSDTSARVGYLAQRAYALGALEAYTEITGQNIEERLLAACQLPRSLKRFDWFQRMTETQDGSLKNGLDVRAAEQMIREQVGKLLFPQSRVGQDMSFSSIE